MKPQTIAFVFARGGSKGVPRKNIRPLAGKPLIAHAIDAAMASRLIDRVVVSTDDTEIASVARSFGAEVPFMRPSELAQDSSPEWLAWQHAIQMINTQGSHPKMDILVSVPTTAPLRSPQDIDACIQRLVESEADIVITVTPALRSPYFNMVVLDEQNNASIVARRERAFFTRQSAPPVFDMTTVAYAARADFVMSSQGIFEGKVQAVLVPHERALDIDSELDFQFAEFLMMQRKAGDS